MMINKTTAVMVAGLWMGASALWAGPPAANSPAKGKQAYGKPFAVKDAPLPIAKVISKPGAYEGKTVKVSGVVTQVCQAKGCWFEVAEKDGSKGARIKSADYSIFVPKDSAGRHAVVEGTFNVTTLSKEAAQHLADDAAKAGKKVAPVTGPVQEFQVSATAVEFN